MAHNLKPRVESRAFVTCDLAEAEAWYQKLRKRIKDGREVEYEIPGATMYLEVLRLRRALEQAAQIAEQTPYQKDTHTGMQIAAKIRALAGGKRVMMTEPDYFHIAASLLDFLETDFCQSGRDVQIEAIRCELLKAYKDGRSDNEQLA